MAKNSVARLHPGRTPFRARVRAPGRWPFLRSKSLTLELQKFAGDVQRELWVTGARGEELFGTGRFPGLHFMARHIHVLFNVHEEFGRSSFFHRPLRGEKAIKVIGHGRTAAEFTKTLLFSPLLSQ